MPSVGSKSAHPLHPALVHFPIACWSLATLGDVASLFLQNNVWWLSGMLLVIGTLSATLTMLSGMFELVKIDEQHPAMTIANRHMKLVLLAWCVYAFSLISRFDAAGLTPPDALEIGLSVSGFVILCFAGWYGARLVYEYGVGVKKISE